MQGVRDIVDMPPSYSSLPAKPIAATGSKKHSPNKGKYVVQGLDKTPRKVLLYRDEDCTTPLLDGKVHNDGHCSQPQTAGPGSQRRWRSKL